MRLDRAPAWNNFRGAAAAKAARAGSGRDRRRDYVPKLQIAPDLVLFAIVLLTIRQ